MWMIDTTGSPKYVVSQYIDQKKAEGWVIMDVREFKSDGTPKQTYYPQYDRQNPISKVKVDAQEINAEILQTDIF